MQSVITNREIKIHDVVPKMDYHVKSYKNHVLRAMECYSDSPVYEEVSELFEVLYPKALKVIEPQIVWRAELNDGRRSIPELAQCEAIIYASATLGYPIMETIEGYFKRDEILEGMLLDAIATGILFKLNEELYQEIYTYVANQHKGMIALSPGERETPITYQTILKEKLGDVNGIRVTEGYLLEPIKSTTSIYGVRSGIELPKKMHNCKQCKDTMCKWRLAPYEG